MQTFENSELELVVNGYEGRAIRKLEDGQLLIRVCCFQLDGQARALVWSLHRGLVDHWALDNTTNYIAAATATASLDDTKPQAIYDFNNAMLGLAGVAQAAHEL